MLDTSSIDILSSNNSSSEEVPFKLWLCSDQHGMWLWCMCVCVSSMVVIVYSDEFFDCVDPMSRAGSSRGVQARS